MPECFVKLKKTESNRVRRAISSIVERLESRRLLAGDASVVQPLTFSLDFSTSIPGTLADTAGAGTGFTWVQPNKNGNEYQPALINLDTAQGMLNITTTGTSAAGGSWEA